MSAAKWNESGRVWEEDHGLLDEEQVAQCQRANIAESLRFAEYMPVPQTEKQKRVEARLEELADEESGKLGITRRSFCGTRAGRRQMDEGVKAARIRALTADLPAWEHLASAISGTA